MRDPKGRNPFRQAKRGSYGIAARTVMLLGGIVATVVILGLYVGGLVLLEPAGSTATTAWLYLGGAFCVLVGIGVYTLAVRLAQRVR